ncbi:MAG: hypothetical protein K6T85_12795 [Gorillibacterium sp.]|nr:hypothetical protein [Gorillibacterium sp.]
MLINLEKYTGKIVDIIYIGQDGKITQRRITVRSVDAGTVCAWCHTRRAPRIFRIDSILAAMPTKEGITA